MREELKLCPFCGSAVVTLRGYDAASGSKTAPECWVSCNTCGASSKTSSFPEKAVEHWNTRPEAAQVRGNLAIELQKAADSHCKGLSIPHDLGMVLERRIRSALEPDTVTGWQNISTAPKDGTVIFVWYETKINRYAAFDSNIKKAKWLVDLGEWQIEGVGGNVAPVLKGWMPLPPAPEKEG